MSRTENGNIDHREVDLYFARQQGDDYAVVRFALHVQKRDPLSIWASMTLAEHCSSPLERAWTLDQAVQAGDRFWTPITDQRRVR